MTSPKHIIASWLNLENQDRLEFVRAKPRGWYLHFGVVSYRIGTSRIDVYERLTTLKRKDPEAAARLREGHEITQSMAAMLKNMEE